jgi:polysaccharide biosynthesis/export protein
MKIVSLHRRVSTLMPRALVLCAILFGLHGLGLHGLPAASAQQQPPAEPKTAAPEKPEVSASAAGAAVDPKSYRIGAEDVLLVRIWGEPDLSGLHSVRPDGKINLPLIGELDAMNVTPVELEASITKGYASILKSPIVMLQVQRVESKKYFLSGEVNRSGAFPLVSPTTILQALTIAGGLREFANGNKIVIMRGSERLKFNYKDVIKGKNMQQNIMLQPGDHVHVP